METKITTVSLAAKEDKYYADKTLYQWNYGQILRIVDADLPMAVEVGFSTTEKSGNSDVRVGSTNNGVTTVAIPNKLFEEERSTDYSIYAFVYVTDENSGTTVHEIVIPVKARAKQGDPSEDPSIDPSIFEDAINAVNASAERAETAEKSAKESADKAKEYAESAGKSKGDVEKARDSAISDIGIEKESALRGIESKTVESLQKIQSQTEASQNSIKQSIADATKKKTELDGAISNATDAKGNLDKAVQSAGNAKTELDTSVGKAGEAKTSLDSSIRSAGEKQLALDATVEQANAVDASLKEQIGSAEQIQANVEQIGKNTQAISSLNEDLEEVKDKKITKFYASNQGETHLADSDNGKIQDMIIYGRSSQFTTTGKNLLKYPYIETTKTSLGITFTDNKDGSINVSGTGTGAAYYNLYSNSDGKRLTLASGTYKLVAKGRNKCNVFINNGVNSAKNEGTFTITDGHNDVWCFIEAPKGLAVDETIYPMIQLASITDESYEPYTGGKPSPNPDYLQEIKSVVNPVVKVCGKNLLQPNLRYNDRVKINIKKGVKLTLICKNGVVSKGGNLKFEKANGGISRFGFDKGSVKQQITLRDDVVAFYYLFNSELSESYALYIGDENTYEPYKEQSMQLHITLNAIPVASGGNVTINSQQYIADRVVEKDGVFGIERNTAIDVPVLTKTLRETPDMKGRFVQDGAFKKIFTPFYESLVNIGYSKLWGVAGSVTDKWIFGVNKANFYISPPKDLNYTSEDIFNALKDLNIKVYGALLVPFFEPLPGDIQAKLRTLVTNYPVTNISVTSDQLDGYTVFNYPISMANGWNYVKKQLGDTRDYIYDMDAKAQDIDTQAAEAYVNSEYAVALTELEV